MIIVFILILFVILAYLRLEWSVMLFLFALPSYQVRFNVLGVPMTLLEGMILISFAVWFLKNWKIIFENLKFKIKNFLKIENCKLKIANRYPFDTEIILMLVVAFIAVAVAGFSNSAFGVFKAYFFEPVLVYILIFNVFFEKTNLTNDLRIIRITNIVWPLALSAFCVSVYALFQKFGILYSPENFLPRVTGPYFYPNAVGLYLGPLAPMMLGYVIEKVTSYKLQVTNKSQIISIKIQIISIVLAIIFSVIAIFFARSEGALIGLLVAFFVMFIFWLFKKYNFKLLIPKIIVFMILLFVFASPFIYLKLIPEYKYFNFNSETLNYITDKTMLKDFSGEVRKQQWRETWEMLTASPQNFIFGTGLSAYQSKVKQYHQEGIFFNKDRDVDFRRKIVFFDNDYKKKYWQPVEIYMYPHNLILNIWSELGMLGVLLFVWIFGKIIYLLISNFSNMNNSQYLYLGLLGSFLVLVVHGLVDVPYFKNDISVLFWVMIALIGMIGLNNKIEEK